MFAFHEGLCSVKAWAFKITPHTGKAALSVKWSVFWTDNTSCQKCDHRYDIEKDIVWQYSVSGHIQTYRQNVIDQGRQAVFMVHTENSADRHTFFFFLLHCTTQICRSRSIMILFSLQLYTKKNKDLIHRQKGTSSNT